MGATELTTAEATFRRPHLRAASLLDVPLDSLGVADFELSWQPYLAQDAESTERRYLINPDYAKATATQPREIVEQPFETPQRAFARLATR